MENPSRPSRFRFDRHEFAGSFGDLGTTLPLIVGMIPAAGLDPCGVLVTFGILQIATGIIYGIPMPVQPLKYMAATVIAGKISAGVLHGAGFAIGAIVLLLAISGLLQLVAQLTPLCVVRGLQIGLGLILAQVALRDFVPALGWEGYALAATGFVAMIALSRQRRVPAGIVLIGLGLVYAAIHLHSADLVAGFGPASPQPRFFTREELLTGLQLLVLPQLALSLGNSVIATERTVADLFPQRRITVRRIGMTYGIMNLVAPWLGGVPVCHGCGGLAGHHYLGARTGGSVIFAGSYYLIAGLFFSRDFGLLLQVFPKPILGVVLMFEALALMRLCRDQAGDARAFWIMLLVGVVSFALPQGFAVGLIVGVILWYARSLIGEPEK